MHINQTNTVHADQFRRLGLSSPNTRRQSLIETVNAFKRAILDRSSVSSYVPTGKMTKAAVYAARVVAAAEESSDVKAEQMEKLVSYLVKRFDGTATPNGVRHVVKLTKPANDDNFGSFESLIPIILISQLFTKFGIIMDMSKIDSWNSFVWKYGTAVLDA